MKELLEMFDNSIETIFYGDFNINWADKCGRQKLKILSKFNYDQLIKKPTRVTRTSKTLIDLIFTIREERIIKNYYLLTGLSDHNMVLTVRKLTKQRLKQFKNQRPDRIKFGIPKSKLGQFELEINNADWDNILQINEGNLCCTSLTETVNNCKQILYSFEMLKGKCIITMIKQ